MDGRAESQELVMLGEHIRSRRMELRMTQEALAEKTGISANTVSRIEGGQMSMGVGTFIKLVQALDTDADRLLGILPEQEGKQYRDIFSRISHLRTAEQEIVLETLETLVKGLHRTR